MACNFFVYKLGLGQHFFELGTYFINVTEYKKCINIGLTRIMFFQETGKLPKIRNLAQNEVTSKDRIGTGRCHMEMWSWIQKSRLGFLNWSTSDSTFCGLRWCPGLLGVSAFRLLCFSPREVATLLWCSHPISPPFFIAQVPSAKVPNWICH